MWGSKESRELQNEQDKAFFKAASQKPEHSESLQPEKASAEQSETLSQNVSPRKARPRIERKSIPVDRDLAEFRRAQRNRRRVYKGEFAKWFENSVDSFQRSPETEVYIKELLPILEQAWQDEKLIPTHFREVLVKYFVQGKSLKQIAKEIKRTETIAKQYLTVAIERLRHSKYFEELYFKNKQGKGSFEI